MRELWSFLDEQLDEQTSQVYINLLREEASFNLELTYSLEH